jgi:hypothetical protein
VLPDWFFSLCDEYHWNIYGNYIEHVDSFWQYTYFQKVDSTCSWAWEIIPSSVIFIDLFLQWFYAWSLSHLLLSLMLGILSFQAIVSGIVFLYSQSIHCWCIERWVVFLINFVSCYFTEAVYGV